MTDGVADADRIAASVEGPPATEAASTVRAAIEDGRVVSLVGACEVDVPGRDVAVAVARHVLLKPDGSVVVHGGDGTAPALALSGNGEIAVTAVDDALEIQVGVAGADGRLRLEHVDLLAQATIDSRDRAGGTEGRTGKDATEERPGGSEGNSETTGGRHEVMRERLLSDPDRLEPGFRPLATERETPAGSVDLYGRDAAGRAVVVEIKGHRAGPAAVGQLGRYVAALRRDLHADVEIRGILVAPSATDRTRRLLEERNFAFRALSPTG